MAPEEFERLLLTRAREVEQYVNQRFPSIAGNITLRFINGNFRAQGYQGTGFRRWAKSKGTILVKSGALRAATYYTTQMGQVTIRNNMPYAKAHNEGFKGTVTVKAHTRNRYSKSKVGTGRFTSTGRERQKTVTQKSGESTVKSHQRKMNIEKRQFMPITAGDTPVLMNAIQRQVGNDLFKLFNT